MASVIKTLQHKASKSRLRKQAAVVEENESRRSKDANPANRNKDTPPVPAVPLPTPAPSAPKDIPAHTSNASVSPRDGFMFWKKKDHGSDRVRTRDISPPKPILRRATDEAVTSPKIRFDGASPSMSPREFPGLHTPPQPSYRPSAGSPASPALTSTPIAARHTSPVTPDFTAGSTPPLRLRSPRAPATASPSTRSAPQFPSGSASPSSNFPRVVSPLASPINSSFPAPRSPTNMGSAAPLPASPAVKGPSPPRTSSRQSSRSSRPGSTVGHPHRVSVLHSSTPPRRTPSVISNASNASSSHNRRRSSRPMQQSSSRTRTSIASYSDSSHGSKGESVWSISPSSSASSSSSYAAFASSSSSGSSLCAIRESPPASPTTGTATPTTPTARASTPTTIGASTPTFRTTTPVPPSPMSPMSPISPTLGVQEEEEHARVASVTPPPSTPKLGPSNPSVARTASGLPMFNVIPATPQQGDSRPSSMADSETSVNSGPLGDMPEEDEDQDEQRTPTVTPRKLEYDDEPAESVNIARYGSLPRLEHAIQLSYGSPIRLNLNLKQLDDVDDDLDSGDGHETESSISPIELDVVEEQIADASVEVAEAAEPAEPQVVAPKQRRRKPVPNIELVPGPPPPPRGPKSPARPQHSSPSLYQAHDDGRSISNSLAQLAALACDLSPLDVDLSESVEQVQVAQSSPVSTSGSPAQRASPVSPVVAPVVSVTSATPPVATAPETPPTQTSTQPLTPSMMPTPAGMRKLPTSRSPRSPIQAPNRPLPPSPEMEPSSSLPSLVSYDSVSSSLDYSLPESMSCESTSWDEDNNTAGSNPQAGQRSFGYDSGTSQSLDDMFQSLSTNALDLVTVNGPSTPKAKDVEEGPTFVPNFAASPPSKGRDNAGLGLGMHADLQPAFSLDEETLDAESKPRARASKRMSAAAFSGHPYRTAFYGTPRSFSDDGSRLSRLSETSVGTAGTFSARSSASFSGTPSIRVSEIGGAAGAANGLNGGSTRSSHVSNGSVSSSMASTFSVSSDLSALSAMSSDDDVMGASIVALSPFSRTYIVGHEDARNHEVGVAF